MSTAGSLLTELRRATSADHQALDARLSPPDAWTTPVYACFLQMSLAVVAPLEPIVSEYVPLYRTDGCSRRDAISSDLRALGASDDAMAGDVPPIAGEGDAYGAAYVLQGSMLGGALIRRAIIRDLGPGAPTTYLDFHGDALGAVWKAFTADLDRFGDRSDAAARSRTIVSARATFAAFAAALTELTCPNPLT